MDVRALRSLKNELSQKKEEVKGQIVQTLHTRYSEFQAALQSIESLNVDVEATRAPIVKLLEHIQKYTKDAEDFREKVNENLSRLQEVRKEKYMLAYFLDIEQKVRYLEAHLGLSDIVQPVKPVSLHYSESDLFSVQNPVQLEYYTLVLAIVMASVEHRHEPFLEQLQPRLARLRAICERSAQKTLVQTLDGEVAPGTMVAMVRTFQFLQVWAQLVVLFIASRVDPLLQDRLTAGRSAGSLSQVFDVLKAALSDRALPLLSHIVPYCSSHERRLLTTPILLRVLEYLASQIYPECYAPTLAAPVFQSSYLSMRQFLHWLIGALDLTDQTHAIKELRLFLNKWPVGVHFQMQVKQWIQEFEQQVSLSQLALTLQRLHPFAAVPALRHRVYKFVCQLLLRFHAHVQSLPLTSGAHAVATLHTLAECRRLFAAPACWAQFRALPLDFAAAESTAVSLIVTELVEQSMPVLRLVKSISSQFRGGRREAPSAPSAFILLVWKPCTDFYVQHAAPHWPVIVAQVVARLVGSHLDILRELYLVLQKTEASLKKLKLAKGRADSAVSDETKIRQQCHLDVLAMRDELEKVPGVSKADSEVWMREIIEFTREHTTVKDM